MRDIYIHSSEVYIPEKNLNGVPVSHCDLGQMAVKVSRDLLLDSLQEVKDQIGVIVVATVGPVGQVFDSVASRIQHELKLSPQVLTVQLSGGCSVALNAVQVARSLLKDSESQYALVVTADQLFRYVTEKTHLQRPSSKKWGDGAAALLLSKAANVKAVKLGQFHTATDGLSWEQCRIINNNGALEFEFSEAPTGFAEYDFQMAQQTVRNCLKKSKLDISAIEGLIFLNRSNGFGDRLRNAIGAPYVEMFQSFDQIGHLGGSDLIINLHQVLDSKDRRPGNYLIYSCGYNYAWSAATISIE